MPKALFYRAPALFDKGRGRSCSPSWWRELVTLCESDKGCGQLPWQFSDGYEPFARCKYSLLESYVQIELNRWTSCRPPSLRNRLEGFRLAKRNLQWQNIHLFRCESRGHVYHEPGTRYDTRYIQRRKRLGRFSLSCWDWMSHAGIGVLERILSRFNARQYQHIFKKRDASFSQSSESQRKFNFPAG